MLEARRRGEIRSIASFPWRWYPVMIRSFLSRFEEQADRLGAHAVAVSFDGREVSYAELDVKSTSLARYLVQQGVPADGLVGICGRRSPELLIAVLAVLKAGACYVPLDASYPAERLAFMLADSRASFLIRDADLALELPALPTLELHAEHPVLDSGDATRLPPRHTPDGLVYAIYTSGSTGMPKGVGMVHRALDNLIEWQLGDSRATTGTATLQFAPLSFDVHFQEMFSTWCSGGRLVLVREELRLDMLRLLELIAAERVERLFLPFIALHSLAEIAVAHGRMPTSLREVITAGEQLQSTRAIRQLFVGLPAARLFNHYGPSETHVVTSHTLESNPESWPALPPIGVALPGVVLSIQNEQQLEVPAGEEGELLLGGVALARGYLHRPELTAERFVERPNGRFYRTGDLVRELPGGAVQFLGRIDGQVKVSGYRVELGEVEVALAAHPSVKEAAVSVHELRAGDKRLAAYVVLEQGASTTGLREFLRERLPEYMLPAYFVAVPALPRTPSGKVDKRALPTPSRSRPELAVEYVAPASAPELVLAGIWQELLAIDSVGVRDGFFDLGGNSLLAVRAVAEVRRLLGKELPVVQFFEHPTIAERPAIWRIRARSLGRRRQVSRRASSERAPIAIIGCAAGSLARRRSENSGEPAGRGRTDLELPRGRARAGRSASSAPIRLTCVPRGVLDGVELFDAGFFGMSPNEAAGDGSAAAPVARNGLEGARARRLRARAQRRRPIGVFAGMYNSTYFAAHVSRRPDARRSARRVPGDARRTRRTTSRRASRTGSISPARRSACTPPARRRWSRSRRRVQRCAAGAVRHGARRRRVDHLSAAERLPLPGGRMLSPDGHTRTFDARRAGTVFSDGVGVVVLKRLDDAHGRRRHRLRGDPRRGGQQRRRRARPASPRRASKARPR